MAAIHSHRSPALNGWGLLLISLLLSGGCLGCLAATARPWTEIAVEGRLRVAVKDNLPPLGSRTSQGDLVGFEIDLARELATRLLGSPDAVDLIPVSNRERLEAVATGRVDLAIAQIGMTPDRARQVYFSPPYYLDGTAILVPRSGGWDTWADLQGKSVAVLENSHAIPYLKTLLTDVSLMPVSSYQAGVEQFQRGSVQAFAADQSVLSGWLAEHPEYQLMPSPLSVVGLGVALPKGLDSHEFNRRVTQEIEALQESGWLRDQADRWGLP